MPRHEVKTVVITHVDPRVCCLSCPHAVDAGTELSYGFGFDGLPGCSLFRRAIDPEWFRCEECLAATETTP